MPPTAAPPHRAAPRSLNALGWGLPLLALLVIGGMWLVLLGSLATERDRIEHDALARAAGLARGYAEHTERTIGQIDQLTRFVAYSYLREGMNADMADLVRQQLASQPGLLVLSVSDRSGVLVASSQPEFAGGDVSDRPYFAFHQGDSSKELQMSEPVVGKLSKRFVVVLSRRLEDARGQFAGVVAVSADPAYFADFYSPDAFGRQGALALMSPDGRLRVQRSGDDIRFQGRVQAPPAPSIAAVPADALRSPRDVDGRQRYNAWRELENFPLHVSTGLDRQEVLASHRQRRSMLYVVFALASVVLAGAFGVLGLLITRLRRSQATASEAHRQFDAASDASLDAFFIFTAVRDAKGTVIDFRYAHCNARGAEMLGLPKQAVIGHNRTQVSPAGGDYRLFDLYISVLSTGEARQAEFTTHMKRLDGRILQHQVVAAGDGVAVTTRDRTDVRAQELAVRAAQEALRASEERIRTITDNLPAMVSQVDADGRYTFVKAQIAQKLRAPASDIEGRTVREIRGESDYAILAPYIARVMAGETVTFEKTGDPDRGEANRFFQADLIPDRDDAGQVRGYYSMTYDVTERKRTEVAVAASGARLRSVTDNIPALVAYFDRDERCRFANRRALRMIGGQAGDDPGYTLREGVGEDLYAQHAPHIPQVLAGQTARFPLRTLAAGRPAHYQAHLVPDFDVSGQVRGFYLMTFNVTALKDAELRQAESEKRLRAIADNIPALVSYIDRAQRLTFANAAFRGAVQKDASAILGQPIREVVGEALYLPRQPMIERALNGERVEFDREAMYQGALRATHTVYVPDTLDDGSTQGLFALSFDITELKSIERKLLELARVDTLTGLPNRLAFNETLPAALARSRRSHDAVALMFLDIDHFKTINDTLGHAAGDLVLAEFARRLLASVRNTDAVARLAGDEFVVVLEHLDTREAAAAVAEKIIAQVQQPPFQIDGRMLQVTTSIGIACQSGDQAPVGAAELLARADAALYGAKAAGRNTFEFFSPPASHAAVGAG